MYGIIFWGNSSNKQKIFKLQKRAIRIITGSTNKDSCRNLFKSWQFAAAITVHFFYSFICGEEQG
jgi:hypothetical protein